MPQLIAAFEWLDGHRHSQRYLREISAPGIDTKFAERHRSDLAGMLGVSSSGSGFLADLGLRCKPALVRFRPAPSLGLPAPLTELAVRSEELAELDVLPRVAVIIENEVSYLSAEVPEDGVVIWGKGFEVDSVGRLPWLAGTDVVYWGDIDTHGFAILDRLRAWLPTVRSVLMDRETLLVHRDRWVTEDRPATSVLTRLTPDERGLYNDLVEAGFGDRVRLEQERIDWCWAEQRLREVTVGPRSQSSRRRRLCPHPARRVTLADESVGRQGALTAPTAMSLPVSSLRDMSNRRRSRRATQARHDVRRAKKSNGESSADTTLTDMIRNALAGHPLNLLTVASMMIHVANPEPGIFLKSGGRETQPLDNVLTGLIGSGIGRRRRYWPCSPNFSSATQRDSSDAETSWPNGTGNCRDGSPCYRRSTCTARCAGPMCSVISTNS